MSFDNRHISILAGRFSDPRLSPYEQDYVDRQGTRTSMFERHPMIARRRNARRLRLAARLLLALTRAS
jgi:hypothetical protein